MVLPLSAHAIFEIERRGISKEEVEQVFNNPEQKIKVSNRREIWQNKIEVVGVVYVLRVIVDLEPELRIVTVYRSSKVKKYWRDNS